MRSLLLLAAATVIATHAAITSDANCTTTDAKWAESAFACDDSIDTAVCQSLLSITAPLVAGTDVDREPLCFKKGGTTIDEGQKQAMIKTCPKSCAFCCLTPAFTCLNKELPGVKCETVTQAQCKDPKWRVILANDCPKTCGLCDQGGCVDAVIQCANDKSICRNIDMQSFVMVNCQKTCGFCTNNSTTTISSSSCIDKGTNCASWVKNGFCINQFYTDVQKKAYCARSCGLC